MVKKQYFGIGFIILIAGAVFLLYALKIGPFGGSAYNPAVQATASISNMKTDEKKKITMMEAFRLGYEEAKKNTEEEPLLISLTSTDDTTVPQGITDGADGKRNAWNLQFGNKKGNINVTISFKDGKVDSEVKRDDNNSLQKGQYAMSDIHIDSPEVVKRAIEELGMRPGNPEIKDDWIKGYHFSIMGFITDPNSSESHYLLRVMGISPHSPNSENDSLRMTVFFDVKTGEILNASEMTGYDKDGRTNWKDVQLKKAGNT